MRTTTRFYEVIDRSVIRFGAVGVALVAISTGYSAAAAGPPRPVSPGTPDGRAAVELRCPTFSWAGVPGAEGYELAVFRIGEGADAEPELVTRTSVPGDARSWTPATSECLDRGGRYAWSVAAMGARHAPNEPRTRSRVGAASVDPSAAALRSALDGASDRSSSVVGLDWAPVLLFEVEEEPTVEDAEQARRTLERYLESRREQTGDAVASRPGRVQRPRVEAELSKSDGGRMKVASAGATPTLGTPSLHVSGNVSLSAASNVFKNDKVFLWDDTDRNTAVGREALSSLTLSGSGGNTAVGYTALRNTTGYNNTASGALAMYGNTTGHHNTAVGAYSLVFNTTGSFNTATGADALRYTTGAYNTAHGALALVDDTSGSSNTAIGAYALRLNTTGDRNVAAGVLALRENVSGIENTAAGHAALRFNTTGDGNTALGSGALNGNTTGFDNTALGRSAGVSNTTGANSIFIANVGAAADSATIKIGTQGTQTTAFIAGIRGVTTAPADAVSVLISSTGQLGTTNSSRALKRDIQDLDADLTHRLLGLRPVAFRFRQHVEADADTPLEFGLIAEEVAEVFPELVVFDAEGNPQTVKYHLLSALLLGELQDQHDAMERQHAELERQRVDHQAELETIAARLTAIEAHQRGEVEVEGAHGKR